MLSYRKMAINNNTTTTANNTTYCPYSYYSFFCGFEHDIGGYLPTTLSNNWFFGTSTVLDAACYMCRAVPTAINGLNRYIYRNW